MESPISPVIANIFMEHFEKVVLQKTPKKPEIWFHYVDTFVIWRHGRVELRKFLIFLNNQHPNIRFIMEKKTKNSPSWMFLSLKKLTIGHQVYRKPTDRYLHAESHHHNKHKNSQLSIHLYIELSSSLTKNTYRWNSTI